MALESLEVVSATSVNASSNGRSGQGWTAFGPGPEIRMNERILFLTAREREFAGWTGTENLA